MVSFWPWSSDSNSPASFEKTLATLSTKITDTQAQLEKTRARARRLRALSTLYLTFAYLVYSILVFVVVGYQNLGAYEWGAIAGGPVIIYVTRKLISTFYTYRIDSLTARLKAHQDERAKTIQKLKDATKYDSTLELIEKYGGEKKKKTEEATDKAKQPPKQGPQPGRTNLPPPPTANIQRPPMHNEQHQQQQPGTPHQQQQQQQHTAPIPSLEPGEEFAPNAFSPSNRPPPPGYSAAQYPESHWYDRIFDVLLGEDETSPKNRIALICQSCRLVNGQAPPGTTSLAEVGKWRCMACHALNGDEDEGQKIIDEVLADAKDEHDDAKVKVEEEDDEEDVSGVMVEADGEEGTTGIDKPEGTVKKRTSTAKS
ncbi:hypothetical protein VHEMI05415 [[Torrubiella] hemipterigena]|uniref:Endoplasmic reticulum junction formation protein lunapark n=1 Tax=[Torrubiella] hemipterigena TaxID=1531966 RepID=A0A0A1TIP4_9HYPO|nr:hypothetical protein VHEMI05415 [[Torrubiella] hemipterigena]